MATVSRFFQPPHSQIFNITVSPTGMAILGLSITACLLYLLYRDYCAFVSLGPGGTPSTPCGYIRIKLLTLVALRDPFTPPRIHPNFRPQCGYLSDTHLLMRNGPRPEVRGIAPQRQTSSRPEIYEHFCAVLEQLAEDPSNKLVVKTSCFEKHGTGLFSLKPVTKGKCEGEVCHVHQSDGSLHLVLHPADAGAVLKAGWGQRHPLARGGWFNRFVPKGFVMVYAPRTGEEVKVVRRIVCASIWWIGDVMIDAGRKDPMVEEGLAPVDGWELTDVVNAVCPVPVTGIRQSKSDAAWKVST